MIHALSLYLLTHAIFMLQEMQPKREKAIGTYMITLTLKFEDNVYCLH